MAADDRQEAREKQRESDAKEAAAHAALKNGNVVAAVALQASSNADQREADAKRAEATAHSVRAAQLRRQ